MKTDLTDGQLRIAIAEWCGFSIRQSTDGDWELYLNNDFVCPCDDVWPLQPSWPLHRIPNYPEDLNAMHEAERKLSIPQSAEYDFQLDVQFHREFQETSFVRPSWHATARQRALALYLTIKQPEPLNEGRMK